MEDNNIKEEFVKVYSLDDKSMKELGQVIKTFKSNNIFQLLATRELHAKEVGKILDPTDTNPRLPNLHHHLNKMVEIGLLSSVTREKNGHKLQYYKAKSEMILLVPEKYYDKAVKSKTLKNTFKNVFKFGGGIGLISFCGLLISYIFVNNTSLHTAAPITSNVDIPIVVFFIIFGIGLIIRMNKSIKI